MIYGRTTRGTCTQLCSRKKRDEHASTHVRGLDRRPLTFGKR